MRAGGLALAACRGHQALQGVRSITLCLGVEARDLGNVADALGGGVLDAALRFAERRAGAKRTLLRGSGGGAMVWLETGSPRPMIALSAVLQMPGSSEASSFACSSTCGSEKASSL